jgi:hypothetical protein
MRQETAEKRPRTDEPRLTLGQLIYTLTNIRDTIKDRNPDEVPVSFRSLKPETLADVLRPVTSVALKAAESFDAPIDITNPVPTWNKVVVIE